MSDKTSLLPSWAIGGSQLGANSRAAVATSIGVPVPPASTERAAGGRSGCGGEGRSEGRGGSGLAAVSMAAAEGEAVVVADLTSPVPPVPPAPAVRPSRSPACPLATHNDPTHWLETADPNRPGWLRAVCTRCGVWIGSRPEEGGSKGKKTQTRRAIE